MMKTLVLGKDFKPAGWKNVITIGVSAHRNIQRDAIPAVRDAVKSVLTEIRELFPDTPIAMINGLAEGGDQLCAEVAEELRIYIHAALPTAEDEYLNTRDFTPQSIAEYKRLCASGIVMDKFVVPDDESEDGGDAATSRDTAFRRQTKYVATASTVLLALWDETPPTGADCECGTSAAVKFALEKTNGAVIEVFSPREGKTYGDKRVAAKYLLSCDGTYNVHNEMPQQLKDRLSSLLFDD